MFLLRKNLKLKDYSRLIINCKHQQRAYCTKDESKNKSIKIKLKEENKKPIQHKRLTSAVVLKSKEDTINKKQEVDFNIAIKNLDKYDDDSQVVYDITDEILGQDEDESKFKYLYQNRTKDLMLNDPKLVERGKEGVFDLDQIVYALKKERIEDIAVIKIPDDILVNKCFVIGSAKSPKHLLSVFEYISKLYKIKKLPEDEFPHYEGQFSSSWKIIDMDIIMLHLFLKERREFYDIEQLWTVGAEFDDKCRIQKDEMQEMIEEHAKVLKEKEERKN